MLARYAASALLFRLRINPQVEHRLNGHTRRRHCKVGFCEDP